MQLREVHRDSTLLRGRAGDLRTGAAGEATSAGLHREGGVRYLHELYLLLGPFASAVDATEDVIPMIHLQMTQSAAVPAFQHLLRHKTAIVFVREFAMKAKELAHLSFHPFGPITEEQRARVGG